MAATQEETATADAKLTAELSRQLALGHDQVTLSALAHETGLEPACVEDVMGQYERVDGSAIERVGGEELTWRLRETDGE